MKLMRVFAVLAMGIFMSPAVHSQPPDWRDVDWGEFIVRFGGSYLHPDDDSTSPRFRVLQHWDLYNTRWEVDSDITWNISGVWRPAEHWGAELMHINGASYSADLSGFTGTPGRTAIGLGWFKATSTSAFLNWYPPRHRVPGPPAAPVTPVPPPATATTASRSPAR